MDSPADTPCRGVPGHLGTESSSGKKQPGKTVTMNCERPVGCALVLRLPGLTDTGPLAAQEDSSCFLSSFCLAFWGLAGT